MRKKNPTPETAKLAEKDNILLAKDVMPEEVNGFKAMGLPEPTRYNDWEVKGRCSDF